MKKENNKYGLWQRLSALALAALLVFGMLPATSADESDTQTTPVIETVADPETLTRPETIYGDNTKNAGKVTVGKSVSDSAIIVDGQSIGLTGDNNFLVTISQSAQVMGLASQSNVPVDVVFVIDTSGSMDDNDRAETLVTAANSAIATLMETNEQNRVAVVAFSSEGSYGGGTSGGAAANVLSSLAHYTGDAATNHLQWVDDQGSATGDNRVYVAGRDQATITVEEQQWVEDDYSSGGGHWEEVKFEKPVPAYRHGKNGGTNIQAGIIAGAKILTAVTNTTYTDPETSETVTRIPFLILVSDGQPTYSYDDDVWYDPTLTGDNAADEQGPGSGSYEGNGFIAALTAAYYKGVITEHYYGDRANAENHCFVYTMGVEIEALDDYENNRDQMVSYVDDNQALAEITLNPKENATEAQASTNSYYRYGNTWNAENNRDRSTDNSFMTYWANYVAGDEFEVRVNGNDEYTFTEDSIADSKGYVNGVGYTGGLTYNDEYFAADNVDDMEAIFEALLRTIQEKAISVPTKVTTGDHDFDGYVTFTDPIGEYMEVKDMKGIVADGRFYQGASFARLLQQFGTGTNPEFDDLLVEVLETRMSLTNSVVDVEDFIAKAVASENQANWSSNTEFDNSIVWWGNSYHTGEEDEQVQVLDFADDDSIQYIEQQKAADAIPADADYVCRSYFFYGTAGNLGDPTANHEYMYFVVRVQRELTAPYRETVVISAPASLLSMEKVLVTETFDDEGNSVYTVSVEPQAPARVVYEVGLWDTINAENVSAVVSSGYAGEAPADGKGQANVTTNAEGQEVYHFFTNDWDRSKSQGSHERAMAKATFDAAADNAFYTYQEDTLLVNADGTPVTDDPAGKVVYYVREYYAWSEDTYDEETGTYTAEPVKEMIAVTIPDDAELDTINGQYYIPAGVYTAATLVVNGDDTYKDNPDTEAEHDGNFTGTSEIVAHPERTGDVNNSHYTVYLGNNGMLSLVSDPPVPEKTVTKVEGTQIVDADGKAVMVGDVLTYTIKAENYGTSTATVTVTDTIPAGTAFVEGSAKVDGVAVNVAPDSDGKLTWTLTNMAPGEVREVSFQVTVTADALNSTIVPGTINNTATVQLGDNGPEYDSNTTTNPPEGKEASDQTNTTPAGEVVVGEILTYHIHFHNDATNDAGEYVEANVTITDVVPAGTTFISADHNGVHKDGTITWTFENVQPNMGGVVTFTVMVDASAVVADPGDDTITIVNNASIQIGDNDPELTNTTENILKVGDLVLTKTVAEGDDTSKTFTLVVTETTGTMNGTYEMLRNGVAEEVVFENGVAIVTIKHGETLTIPDLPEGTQFTVAEDTSETPGWTPSYNIQTVTIDAETVATVNVTNDYSAQKVTFQLKGQKETEGEFFPAGTFTFRAVACDANGEPLTGTDARTVIATATVTGGEQTINFVFSGRDFTEADKGTTRYYLISEDTSDLGGVTTDTTVYMLKLVITDDGKGQMVVTAEISTDMGNTWRAFDWTTESVVFTNTYEPAETTITIGGDKVMTGRTQNEGEFSFQLIDPITGQAIGTATNVPDANDAHDGTFTFPSITYTADDMVDENGEPVQTKTFTYYIREVQGNASYTTYDPTYYEVKVTVTDVNGQLKAEVTQVLQYKQNPDGSYPATGTSVDEDEIVYYNHFDVQDVTLTLKGTKTLTGKGADGLDAGEFSFSVYASDASGSKGALVSSGVNNADGTLTFAPIGFTVEDMMDEDGNIQASKTFFFLVVEDAPAEDGPTFDPNMYYDPAQYLVAVTVTYTANGGTLEVVTTTYMTFDAEAGAWVNANGIAFENIQNPATITFTPAGSKTVTGDNLPTGLRFSFRVVGMGTDINALTLGAVEGTGVSAGTTTAGDSINFTSLVYDADDVGKTFYYLIEEVPAAGTMMEYDTTQYVLAVTVGRDSNNALTVSHVYYEVDKDEEGNNLPATDDDNWSSVSAPSFTNKYDAYETLNLSATKKLERGTLTANAFDFRLQLLNPDGTLGDSIVDGVNNGSGVVSFGTLIFTDAQLNDTYKIDQTTEGEITTTTYEYRVLISEIEPAANAIPGVTYDPSEYIVVINWQVKTSAATNVPDCGKPYVVAVYKAAEANGVYTATGENLFTSTTDDPDTSVVETGIQFVNTYNVSQGTQVTIEATKTLTGRDQAAGEFGFVLYRKGVDADGKTVWHNIATAFNTTNGSISFTRHYNNTTLDHHLAFGDDDTYTVIYRINEIDNNLGGIDYSDAVYYVEVVIAHNESDASYSVESVTYYTEDESGNQTVVAYTEDGKNYYTDASMATTTTIGKAVVFANKYTTNDAIFEPIAGKVLLGAGGTELNPAGFSFRVVEVDADGNILPMTSGSQTVDKVVSTGTSDAEGNVSFSDIIYTVADMVDADGNYVEQKTFYYVIEEIEGTTPGVTYSNQKVYVVVTVRDDGEGVLTTSAVYYTDDPDAPGVFNVPVTGTFTFRNHYGPGSTSLDLELNKVVQVWYGDQLTEVVYDLQDSQFDFEVYEADKDFNKTGTTPVTVGTNNADGTITFGTITYTREDVYGTNITTEPATKMFYYVIEEVVPSDAGSNGIAVDTKKIYVTVTVTDDGYGNMTATASFADTDATAGNEKQFTNTYTVDPVTVDLTANKTLTGKDLAAGEFSFQLYSVDEGKETLVETVGNLADGSITFQTLSFDTPGTYTYKVVEVIPEGAVENDYTLDGVTYTNVVYTVEITVTDDGMGNLSAAVVYSNGTNTVGGMTFTNTYTPPQIEVDLDHAIGATKTIVDAEGNVLMREDVTFTFKVRDLQGNLVATGTAKGEDADENGIIDIDFGTFSFAAAGEYRYLITETAVSNEGYTIDTNVWCVHIIVRYNSSTGDLVVEGLDEPVESGSLYVAPADVYTHLLSGTSGHTDDGTQPQADEENPAFVNVYETNDTNLALTITKTLVGRPLKANEFTFYLYNEDGTIAAQGRNDANGTVTFYLEYTLADMAGAEYDEESGKYIKVFEYTVDEAASGLPGVTDDESKPTVTVTVTDDGKGNLSATVAGQSVTGTGTVSTGITFENTYTAASVDVQFQALKRMEGMPLANAAYTFELRYLDEDGKPGDPVLDAEGDPIVATNAADGTIIFSQKLTYTDADMVENGEAVDTKVFTYVMVETQGQTPGVTFDATSFTVTVTVTDDYNGNLVADVAYSTTEGTYDMPVFINIYEPEGVNVVIDGDKKLTGRDQEDGEFTFQLIDEEGNVVDEVKNVVDEDGNGSFTFAPIFFDAVGTHTYTVVEVKGELGGVTYDDTVYTVTITVTDEGYDGQLDYTITYNNGTKDVNSITFENIYAAAEVKVDIEATKELTGKDMTAGQFTFELVNKDDPTDKHTATNGADGSIVFEDLTFDEAGVYTYIMSEVQGTDDNMDYDETEFTVTITVTDNGDGTFTAVPDYNGKTPVFKNVYTPDPITVTLEGVKHLEGRDQKAGEFQFEVRDAEGNLFAKGENKADGTIVFEDIEVEAEMDLILYVTEVKGTDNQIEYDDYTYRVKLVVTNENGKLVADVTYMDGKIEFFNEYEVSETPDTGDDTPVAIYVGLLAVSAVSLMALVLLGRKKKQRKFC